MRQIKNLHHKRQNQYRDLSCINTVRKTIDPFSRVRVFMVYKTTSVCFHKGRQYWHTTSNIYLFSNSMSNPKKKNIYKRLYRFYSIKTYVVNTKVIWTNINTRWSLEEMKIYYLNFPNLPSGNNEWIKKDLLMFSRSNFTFARIYYSWNVLMIFFLFVLPDMFIEKIFVAIF